MYVVIRGFADRQFPTKVTHTKSGDIPQAFHVYNIGDAYPAPGAPLPTMGRIRELATDKNLANVPLIQWVPDPEAEESVSPAKDTEKTAADSEVDASEKGMEQPGGKPKRPRRKKVQKDGDK